jgi:hypothetical protein
MPGRQLQVRGIMSYWPLWVVGAVVGALTSFLADMVGTPTWLTFMAIVINSTAISVCAKRVPKE